MNTYTFSQKLYMCKEHVNIKRILKELEKTHIDTRTIRGIHASFKCKSDITSNKLKKIYNEHVKKYMSKNYIE